jgi:hypothetical protein
MHMDSLLRVDLKPVRSSIARFGLYWLERTVPLTFDVRCARGFAHPTSPLLRHFSLYWVILLLSFGRIWVSMSVVRQPASYPMGTRDSFPGGKAAGA